MGAYEFVPVPVASKPAVTKRMAHGLHVRLKVDPEGVAAKAHVIATHGKKHISSAPFSVVAGTRPKTSIWSCMASSPVRRTK